MALLRSLCREHSSLDNFAARCVRVSLSQALFRSLYHKTEYGIYLFYEADISLYSFHINQAFPLKVKLSFYSLTAPDEMLLTIYLEKSANTIKIGTTEIAIAR